MIDKPHARLLRIALTTSAATAIVFACPAMAGEKILYGEVPDWVVPVSFDSLDTKSGPSTLVYDWQHRLEGGVVTSYEEHSTRIDNPQTLMDEGTISLTWLPDKGDLTVHKVEILRGDESIDLIAGGAQFEVIRREQGLEQRLLDGELTATLAVPGLKVGDILRVIHSTTLDDQALGNEMQVSQPLWTKPWQVGVSRAIVSWPEDEAVFWRAEESAKVAPPIKKNGYSTITVNLPIAEPQEMPADAPSRYRRSPILRVGTYADWQELSRSFAPHYIEAAKVADDSDVAAEAVAIMAETADPLERTALALRRVQDDVSYLLNGLDGGNYMPQNADLTWDKRYGDCKAKSVLLFALLKRMGIDAEPVLVSTQGGDAMPELLPIPGNFDHMIVRARINDVDYWLDGTSTATRITNIADVPPFSYALPLTETGSDLVAMTQRPMAWPNMEIAILSDYSAGADFPPFFQLEMKMYGVQGAGLRALADEADEDTLKELASGFASSQGPGGAITDISVEYDDDAAVGVIAIKGVSQNEFEWRDGRLQLPTRDNAQAMFNPNRARAEWRDIPVQTAGPARNKFDVTVILPDNMSDFSLSGPTSFDGGFANTTIKVTTIQSDKRIGTQVDLVENFGEIAPDDVAAQKLAARRLNSENGELVAPDDVVWRWDLTPDELARRTAPILAAYDKAVGFAAEDDFGPLMQRARFRAQIFDWKGALKDIDTLLANRATADLYLWRSSVLVSLDRNDQAIAAAQTSYELDPSNETAFFLAELLAYQNKRDEALALLESLPVGDEESGQYASAYATVAGLAGKTDDALALLSEEVAEKPTNASVLNADCWFRGLFNVEIESAMPTCTKAIERATDSAPMLDSRAMVSYRMGDYDAALKDLDSALELVPGLAASLYMRGIVRLEKGDGKGRDDIVTALRISPEIATRYAAHGVSPKR